jgi:uncharacterized protein
MNVVSLIFIGALFGLGLVVSEMTNPARIIGFLDFTGDFDPSLVFVMGGAVSVHALLFRVVRRRPSPLLGSTFSVPPNASIDIRLLAGSALFGVGWGLAGYCPGPALTGLVALELDTSVFVGTMLLGMFLFALQSRVPRPNQTVVASVREVSE